MSNEIENRREWRWKQRTRVLVLIFSLVAVTSCQDLHYPYTLLVSFPIDLNPGIQEGEVTLQEGTESIIRYKKPYQAPPRLVIVELSGAHAEEWVYSKSDFQIVKQESAYFTLRNNHIEHGKSWATVKWRAEGVLANVTPAAQNMSPEHTPAKEKTAQDQLIDRIKKMGGKVTVVSNSNKQSITAIDLHRTRITDADLVQLEGLTTLQTLNLYNTAITDAGLQSVSKLTSIQTLYLNNTRVTDAGLFYLQYLTKLSELGLNQTPVSDQGLRFLKGLTNLRSLTLGSTGITDQGLVYLKGLRTLKHLYLRGSKTTAAGIQELKKTLPNVEIIR